MDINSSNLVNSPTSYTPAKATGSAEAAESKQAVKTESVLEELNNQDNQDTKEKKMSAWEIDSITASLNKIMQLTNADLQFKIHDKTQQLMVQLVDIKEDKVLKEFPPHELLDTMAAIRDYIGLLLDKKA